MAHLFYNTLGNVGLFDTAGNQTGCGLSCLTNSGPFFNIQLVYWSGTEFASLPGFVWSFGSNFGDQGALRKSPNLFAWAVRSGDVSTVPIPAAVWLLGSGLVGLLGFGHRSVDLEK